MKSTIGDLDIKSSIKTLSKYLANDDVYQINTYQTACYLLELYKEVDRLRARVEELENHDRQGNCV